MEWIHSFTVTETATAKGGYTIYKITSVLFPRSVPEALTCLTVWKRFHDVKRLHRELSRRHKNSGLQGRLPTPTDSTFFKRFDADVIERRKEYILQLLDFSSMHPALYKCHAFAQFFSDPQQTSPLHQLYIKQHDERCKGEGTGAIAEICDKIDLLYDGLTLLDPECDKLSSTEDNNNDNDAADVQIVMPEKNETVDIESKKPQNKDYTRFLTPMASIESDDSDYIYEAALEFSHAVQAEANLEYSEAHTRYKHGVELLLHGSKDDSNDERKYIAKTKISKYLARADDIFDKFLSGDACLSPKSNFQLSIDVTPDSSVDNAPARYLERPWNQLAKYKVLRVLGERVMQVQSITEPKRPTYVMKGIEKPSSNSPTQTIFLPQLVPYMVDLLAFFQSEQKIFLLLKQAEGGSLLDYMQTFTAIADKTCRNLSSLFPEDTSDEDTDKVLSDDVKSNATNVVAPTESTEFADLVRCSQQLLQSVSHTLKEVEVKTLENLPIPNKTAEIIEHAGHSNIPEASLKQWARELAVAIQQLHGKGIILSDLHMENLLLGNKGQLLLSYFYQNEGLTSDNYVHKAYSPLAVSGHFVAPERPLTFKSDWWSYGVVLYQLLLGLSFKAAHPGQLDMYGYVQFPESVEISDSARDLLENLLQQVPDERFDYEQIQEHDFFKGTNWEEVRRNGLNHHTHFVCRAAKVEEVTVASGAPI